MDTLSYHYYYYYYYYYYGAFLCEPGINNHCHYHNFADSLIKSKYATILEPKGSCLYELSHL